jgi:hypothetical protein
MRAQSSWRWGPTNFPSRHVLVLDQSIRRINVLMLALVALSCVVSLSVRAQSSATVRWEYKVISTAPSYFQTGKVLE